MKRQTTINDVAKKAGVSKSTVSHVLNNTRFVEADTRQRVLDAISELGFRPSTAARSLMTNRTQTIGVIVSDASNHFFGEMLRGIESVVMEKNFSLLVCNTDERLELEEHYLNLLLMHRVDGIIAAATSREWPILRIAELKHLPVVFVDRTFDELDNHPYVGVDNVGGARIGTQYLIDCGFREIGVLAGFQRLSTMRGRLAGFQHVLAEHKITVPEEWIVPSPLSVEGGREAARKLFSLPNRPQAVLVNNNLLGLGALLALRDVGIRCPDDISMLCFDDHPWAAVAAPPLTVICQPSHDIGQRAARMMLALLNNEVLEQTKVTLTCELIIRESCGKRG
jgi:LacI family transcriptional regulator